MIILGIDIGHKNFAMSILQNINNKIDIICVKKEIIKISYNILNKIYNDYKLYLSKYVLIEEQFKGKKNIYYMGFITSFFQSKNINVIIVKPYTYGMNITTYAHRKKMTIDILNTLINKCDNTSINKINKFDDVADATCLILKWMKININVMHINSIQII
ncbi:holliday junction resolvase [Alphaentomopoxvirus acuprea]|uniref:Holliday junction resolvase n=1 Tax=Alphaentomopoxvirus acuprea TaxID=62099 RepID=W6JIS6_9POXV|nr:holliday junction resolvase [Anomala cuprea entomopoxvirus]BAO49463.1 holliday junction resolvase [Anomala cuprea entomopoxvirus]